jgi:hypothetical protein
VVELARDDLERVGVEDLEQLLLGETEQRLQLCGRPAQNSWFSSRRVGP